MLAVAVALLEELVLEGGEQLLLLFTLLHHPPQTVVEDAADLGFFVLDGLVGDVSALGEDFVEAVEGDDCAFQE